MIRLVVNESTHEWPDSARELPLLYALRNDLGLRGPRFGCGLGQCGACTVHIDGQPKRSCLVPLGSAHGLSVKTLEGLGTPERPSLVQQAFIDEQAVQCGYCINGMVMEADALLRRNSNPSEAQIRQALSNNLCRCGTHIRIVRAVRRAARLAQAVHALKP
jgi:nicotinate dehydrogenase subunit A